MCLVAIDTPPPGVKQFREYAQSMDSESYSENEDICPYELLDILRFFHNCLIFKSGE